MPEPASPETLALAGLWTTVLDVGFAVIVLAIAANAWAPTEDLPWKPLRLDAPMGFASQMQFARAAANPVRCRAVLHAGDVGFVDAPLRTDRFCTTADSLRLGRGVTALRPAGPILTCPEALAYALWMRLEVQPAARAELGSPVAVVEHYGSYACRNIYGEAQGRPSEHARANALDVAGFRLADGRRVTVAADFAQPTPSGRFVRAARDGACRWFHGVLSPDYNAAHRDHLHLDFGAYRVCR
jgi:hypothetical protein